jgi:membrane protein insertase Oxa1/YidC/SpoIIIJ
VVESPVKDVTMDNLTAEDLDILFSKLHQAIQIPQTEFFSSKTLDQVVSMRNTFINYFSTLLLVESIPDGFLNTISYGMMKKTGGLLHEISQIVVDFHLSSGLNYWAIIVLFTLSYRVLLLPLSARIYTNSIKVANLAPELGKLQEEYRVAQATGYFIQFKQVLKLILNRNTEAQNRTYKKMMNFWKEKNCSPFASMKYILMQVS